MPKTISATDARANFAEIIDRVLYSGDEYIVQKLGKPAAIITSIKTDKKKRKIKPEADILSLAGIFKDKALKGKSIDEIIKLEKKAVAEAVAERYKRKMELK